MPDSMDKMATTQERNGSIKAGTTWAVARAVAKFHHGTEARYSQTQAGKRRGSQWSYAKRDSFIERFTTQNHGEREEEPSPAGDAAEMDLERLASFETSCCSPVDPDGTFLFFWLMLVTCAVGYNMWIPIVRVAINGLDSEVNYSLAADLFFDSIYLVDIFVQARTTYMEHGLFVEDRKFLALRYFRSRYFLYDVISVLPVDLIVLIFTGGIMHHWLRLTRWIKIYRARNFLFKLEAAAAWPNFWRIFGLTHSLMFLVHNVAVVYLTCCRIMLARDLDNYNVTMAYPDTVGKRNMREIANALDDGNVSMGLPNITLNHNDTTMEYLNSIYWATVTLTTIGDVEWPQTESFYLIQIFGYLVGIFVFAAIVGQVGSVVDQRNAPRMEFERQLDHAKKYMRAHDIPNEIRKSILGWYEYNWSRGWSLRKTETDGFEMLPTKLRTELAIHVNLKTLKKVSFFTKCEPEFLHDLVLRMQLVVSTPGELVCRKGEVAREMFIISDGLLEVLGEDDTVIRTMQTGEYFGEIGLLMMDGSKRRTADVRSLGYSDLFVVTKEDILNLLEDYPNAKSVLQERVRLYGEGDEIRKNTRSSQQNGHCNIHIHQEDHRSSSKFKDRMKRSILVRNSTNMNDLNVMNMTSLAASFRHKRYKNAVERKKCDKDADQASDKKLDDDLARDVMTSIEDTLFSKLSRVSREYNRLYTRSKILEEELDKKTKELEELKGKHVLVSSESEPASFKVGESDVESGDKFW